MILFFAFPYFLFLSRFFLLPIIPLIYSIWFFLLPIQLFSSHLFFFSFPYFLSLSLPHFFSSLPIIPFLIYFNLFFPLCIQLFSSHLFILHLFHLIFIPSLHTPLSLSLTTPHLLFFFFFLSLTSSSPTVHVIQMDSCRFIIFFRLRFPPSFNIRDLIQLIICSHVEVLKLKLNEPA